MPDLLPIFKKAYWSLAAAGALYAIIILALLNPWLQRHALYAHRLHSGFWHDVDKPESFGFAKHQITPFNISTPDGETLYAWHVLPLNVYAKHRESLVSGHAGDLQEWRAAILSRVTQDSPDATVVEDETEGSMKVKTKMENRDWEVSISHTPSVESSKAAALSLRLLKEDPDARVVINFHGNAGHVGQGWRTDTYRLLTSLSNTHVLTVDYRGFGKSTGSPTESGLITDGIALVNWALHVAKIPPHRITILGQSLGTAVASAVGLHFANSTSSLLPAERAPTGISSPTVFAGIVLVAPFTSLPNLLLSYRIGGILPILSPLRPYPYLQNLVSSRIKDTWPTAERLVAYSKALSNDAGLLAAEEQGKEIGGLQILHALNDGDISFRQSEMLFSRITGIGEGVRGASFKPAGSPRINLDIVEYGGHNRIVTYASVALAVMRAFDGAAV